MKKNELELEHATQRIMDMIKDNEVATKKI